MNVLSGVAQNIVSAVVGFFVAKLLERRRHRRLVAQVRRMEPGRAAREALLILSCREDFEVPVQKEAAILKLPVDGTNVIKIYHDGAFPAEESAWMEYVGKIRAGARRLRSEGYSRVHLFTNVPVAMAVFAGALLDNGPEVVVYHFFNGIYRRVGGVAFETVHSA